MFHAYGAEEEGLLGSFYFCNNPTVIMDNVAAMVNLDMVGRLRDNLLIVNGAASVPGWELVLAFANEPALGISFRDESLYGSDHVCFNQRGRPAIFLYTRTHDEYHTAADDPWLINVEGMLRVGELALGALQSVATASGWPGTP
jgi:Zn-dependent M28 family amino/carboxypeptidase